MTVKEQIIQELDRIPESCLEKVLDFLCFLEQPSQLDSGELSKAEVIVQRGLNIAITKTKRSSKEIWSEFESIRNKTSEGVASEQI